jgi:hypothetical protein
MIQEEPDEEPLAPAVRLFAIYFDTIDYLLILANAILYGVVFVMRRNRKNTDL